MWCLHDCIITFFYFVNKKHRHDLFEAVSLQQVQNKPVWFACGPRAKRKFNEYARELITLNALCCTLFHSLSCHFYSCLLEKKNFHFLRSTIIIILCMKSHWILSWSTTVKTTFLSLILQQTNHKAEKLQSQVPNDMQIVY